MNKIIMRNAGNQTRALRIAQGFEDAGATVLSICPNHVKSPGPPFLVFARYDNTRVTVDNIDNCINSSLQGKN